MIVLLALSLFAGMLAVGYGRLGVKEPGAGYNLKGLACLFICIVAAFSAGRL